MLTVQTRHAIHPTQAKEFSTEELRESFLAEDMFVTGEIRLIYTHYDRFILGGAVPASETLVLDVVAETRTANFLDRRELGIFNVGGPGKVETAGEVYDLAPGDVLYVGRGSGAVKFSGDGRFYLTSAPAHRTFPTRLVTVADSVKIPLGATATANRRTIYQYIHPDVMESCQLTMGRTILEEGSVWNTMPTHVHDRRMEAYLYTDVKPDARIVHLMGEPNQTRHLFVANEQAILSPPWSIHSGCGTQNYSFIWAMAGENMDFTDMDFVKTEELR